MSLETRIAVIGVVGALTGTLVGGLVTYAVTQQQISSQKSESRRADRLSAYSNYYGDASRLWAEVFQDVEVTPRPTHLDPSARKEVKDVETTLTRDYALVALVAPQHLRQVAHDLAVTNTKVWNALNSDPIDYALYTEARGEIRGANSPLTRFTDEARRDLGSD